jgi:hypothetical protein
MTQDTPIRRVDGPRPLLLDLSCCADGAATSYHRAGLDVHGFNIARHPNCPFATHHAAEVTA